MKKLYILLICFLFISISGNSQVKEFGKKAHSCGFDKYINSESNTDSKGLKTEMEKKLKYLLKNKSIQKSGPDGSTIVIPIVVTIIHGGVNQPENISDNQVLSQFNALNEYFEPYGFKFCFAKKDKDGNVLTGTNPGIQRIENSTLTNLDASTELINLNPLTPQFPIARYINIYVVKAISDPQQSGTVGGLASMFGVNFEGIVMSHDHFGKADDPLCTPCTLVSYANQGKVIVHEMGHFLGLYHTFNGSCTELNGGNCDDFGDYICDTPPVFQQTSGCPVNADTCDEGANNLPDRIDNYMDYSDQECTDNFTDGQYDRMREVLLETKYPLTSPENLIFTGIDCVPQIIIATFTAQPTFSPCSGQSVTFYSQPIPNANYAWNFGDGATSSLQNPSHSFLYSEEPYIVTLTVSLNGNSMSYSKNVYVTNCQPILNEDTNWFFSNNNILSFSSGTPIAVPPSNPIAFYMASAVQSNASGQVQFFTNSNQVYNSSQTVINPTNQLSGSLSNYKTSLIVPTPGNSNQYYIFTKFPRGNGEQAGFRYSKVTMTGGVPVLSNINTGVNFPATYSIFNGAIQGGSGITAIKSPTGYWIISTQIKPYPQPEYIVVYSLDASTLAFVSETPMPYYHNNAQTVASPDGNRLLLYGSYTILYDFNKQTGQLSSPVMFSSSSPTYENHACFSPDSQVLYTTSADWENIGLYQYDLNAADIFASRKKITDAQLGEIQLGPDNKIYTNKYHGQSLSVIHKPNNVITPEDANACNYTSDGPWLNSEVYVYDCLPNIIVAKAETAFDNTMSYHKKDCYTYQFNANFASGPFSWSFGDTASGSNTSSISNPVHTFSGPGEYIVTLTAGTTTITKHITIGGIPPVIYGSICADSNNKSNLYSPLSGGQTLQWSILSGSGTLTTPASAATATVIWSSLPGVIRLTSTDAAGCVTYTDQEIIDCGDGNSGTPCNPHFTFSSPEASNTQTYNTSEYIITQNQYTVGPNNDITLKAESYILLKPNTHIKAGSLFLAKIQPCTAGRPSLKSGEEGQQIIAWPNPTDGLLHIEGIKFREVVMFDISGKNVFYSTYDGIANTTIDMNGLQQGMYFLKVTGVDDSIETIKIIKE